jgi:hypothetical protein
VNKHERESFPLTLDHCVWCNTPLGPDATRRKRLKELTRFPSYFETVFIPICKGERKLEGDELVVKVGTYREAHLLYKDWEGYTNALRDWAKEEGSMKREERAQELDQMCLAASAWKIEARLQSKKTRPTEKAEWMQPAIIRFMPRHKRTVDLAVMQALESALKEREEREEDDGFVEGLFQ